MRALVHRRERRRRQKRATLTTGQPCRQTMSRRAPRWSATRPSSTMSRCSRRTSSRSGTGIGYSAACSIRSSFVETITAGALVSSIFPSLGSDSRRRSLLDGVPRDGSPASSLLLRRSDSSPSIPPRFVAFAWRYRRNSADGDDEVSQVPGQPLRTCRGLRPRRSRCAEVPGYALRLRVIDVAFRYVNSVGLRNKLDFGAQSLGPHACCLRFAATVGCCTATQDSLPADDLRLGRSGLSPAGCFVRFQLLHDVLLTQAWPGALTHPTVCDRRSAGGILGLRLVWDRL
jgi:hypothetical protein